MLKQMLYDANYDKDLLEQRTKAKELCYDFNNLRPSDEKGQKEILKEKERKNHLEELNENFYSNHNLVILDGGKVTFGDNVFIAPNCGFYTAGHPIDFERRNKELEYAYPISVGNNVWIGAGVQLLPSVTIGDNVVIGGGSVVVKDIPSNSVAVGNPCKAIRAITEKDKLETWDRISK